MLFISHATEALATLDVADTTRATHRVLIERHAGALRRLPVAEVGRRDVEAVLAEARAAGLAPASVRRLLMALRAVLEAAVTWGRASANPCEGVSVRVPRRAAHILTREQLAQLDEALAIEGSHEGALLRLVAATGLRFREAEALQPGDLDGDRLTVRQSKTANGVRVIDVPDHAVELARHVCDSGRIPRQTVRRRLRAACRAAGVPEVTVHGLRHTRATLLLLAGAPALYVCEQLGHSSPAFTESVYGHVHAAARADRRRWANA